MSEQPFDIDCEKAVSSLQSALIELFDAGEMDPTRPQEISRRVGINKTLTWNISKFLEAKRPIDAVSFVPAPGSISRLVDAFPSSPRLTEAKLRVTNAAAELEATITRHADDRGTLELILDNAAGVEEDRLELSRRLTFRGNSGICGVQARTRLSTWFLAPNADDETRLDTAVLRGCVRVRRLRPDVEWPIFKRRHWSSNKGNEVSAWEPVDPKSNGVPLMLDFCRGDLPRVDSAWTPEGQDYILRKGPVGNLGAFDCFTGEIARRDVGRFAEAGDDVGEVGSAISIPSEVVILDLIYHRSIDMQGARALIFGETFAHGTKTPADWDGRVLPMRPRLTPLPGSPPAVATPLVPGYADMVQRIFEKGGWNASQFAGLRLEVQYPPMHSQIVIRFPLPPKP